MINREDRAGAERVAALDHAALAAMESRMINREDLEYEFDVVGDVDLAAMESRMKPGRLVSWGRKAVKSR